MSDKNGGPHDVSMSGARDKHFKKRAYKQN